MLTEWDKDEVSDPQETYETLLRGIRWADSFGIRFVESSQPLEVAKKICTDLSDLDIKSLRLTNESALSEIREKFQDKQPKVLVLTGLESLIKKDPSRQIPFILGHLNWQRENYLYLFPNTVFVFVTTKEAVTQVIRIAPDFFDWGMPAYSID